MGRTIVNSPAYHKFLPLLLLLITSRSKIVSSAAVNMEGDDDAQELLLHDTYYTLHQDHTLVNLKIDLEGNIEWDEGTPTLYSVFREQVVRSRMYMEGDTLHSQERTYTLEATATRYWICMSGKGRLYTVNQQEYQKMERERLRRLEKARIRHETTKRTRRRWSQASPPNPLPLRVLPPRDCLFKTFEFNPKDSYERSVGIYSSVHSNTTHGRFLSISPEGEVRTYRKPFSTLHHHHHIKISQVPIRYLSDMVSVTRFGRGAGYNGAVRQCILHLLRCPNHQQKIVRKLRRNERDGEEGKKSRRRSRRRRRRPQGRKKGGNHHFYKIIERCKRRADRTDRPPKCSKRDAPPEMRMMSGGHKKISGRSRKRRKSHLFLENFDDT